MKIAIGLEENNYNSQVDRRFGRASFFILIDSITNNYEIIENEAKDEATGAGLKVVKNLVNLGVKEIIAGEIGPKAAILIEEFNIPVYKLGELKKVNEVMENYREKRLEKFDFSSKPQGLRMA
ncbi:MAG: NifB/NifX family molybdenum-iron cluster-binding protein [Fusobacterium sp.]|nr:NifB/NifX family molybdenum-iron cluster-binding protein [Fusobacterium sp.]